MTTTSETGPRKAPLVFPAGRREGFVARFTGQARWVAHYHNELELNLVVRGRATVVAGGDAVALERGSLLWLPPGYGHGLSDHDGDCLVWVAFFTPTLVRRNCPREVVQSLLQVDGCPPVRRLPPARTAFLHTVFDDLVDAAPDRFEVGLPYALLTAWDAYTHYERAHVEDVHEAVLRAAFLLSNEPGDERLDELASRVGLSTSTLSRSFKRYMGMSVVEYRNARRLDRFFELSRAGVGVTTAAMRAGFGSYPQFYRVFKKATGRSPRQHGEVRRK